MKAICIGHAAYDITTPVETFPKENTKNRVQSRIECGGGPAGTAAYLLGKWGVETYFAGIVGDDLYGNNIKKEYDAVGVNTDYMQISKEHTTTSSYIIANRENGSRTSFAHRNKKMAMKEIELDFEPDIILFDGQEVEMTNKLLDKYPNAISIIDAGRPTEDIIKLAKRVNYLVCSREFSENVSNIKINNDEDYLKVYNYMKNEFKNEVIITLEEKGCLYLYEDRIKSTDNGG